MWAPAQEVTIERNPYQYVPSPKDHIFWFPLYSTLLNVSETLSKEYGLDTSRIEDARKYFAEFQKLRPERNEDIDKGIEMREEFLRSHPFSETKE